MMPRSEERITDLGNNPGKMRTVFIIYSWVLLLGERGLHIKRSPLSCRNRKQQAEHAPHRSSSFTFSLTFGQLVFPNDTPALPCFLLFITNQLYPPSALMYSDGSLNTEGHSGVVSVCSHPREIDVFLFKFA